MRMVRFRRHATTKQTAGRTARVGTQTAVETVGQIGRSSRTHVQYSPLFVVAQDYDDAMRLLTASLEPVEVDRLAHDNQTMLTLFSSIARVVADMVVRGERIATLSKSGQHVGAEEGSLEALRARQVTEQALVNEGLAAISEEIARMRLQFADSTTEQRVESSQALLDVAPYPQPGSAAAELSVLLSSNRARHRNAST
jgi:hypothetical protein